MIILVGDYYNQVFRLLQKRNGEIRKTETLRLLYVPMICEK